MKKNIFIPIISCVIILIAIVFNDKITSYTAKIIGQDFETEKLIKNEYSKDHGYFFVNINRDLTPLSKQDLKNILFSIINCKEEKFTFYCPSEYADCLKDIEELSDDALLLTHLNNYVHPFNSFTNIKTTISESREINLEISYLYNNEEINNINKEVDKIIASSIKDDMEDYDKIKTIHDYIANNTKYDVVRNESGESNHDSFKATGLLFSKVATCNGYADTMAIFLSKLGFDNYKIATTPEEISYSSTGHVWNAVYYDNEWVHLDLTWDDPVSKDGRDYLYHKYFLVNNEELQKADSGDVLIEEHNYDDTIYLEFNIINEKVISEEK